MSRDMIRKWSYEKFVARAKLRHGDFYKYSLEDWREYQRSGHYLTITCPLHGEWTQPPYIHLRGSGCSSCGEIKKSKVWKVGLEELKLAVNDSFNFADLANKIGYADQHYLLRQIKFRLDFEGIDYSRLLHRKTRSPHRDIQFTDKQLEVINGSLLGDGSLTVIRRNSVNSSFVCSHCKRQELWFRWKYDVLNNLCHSKPRLIQRQKIAFVDNKIVHYKCEESYIWTFGTVRHPLLTKLEREWYKRNSNGEYVLDQLGRRIKIIPDIQLSPLIIAAWYFDDGYIGKSKKNGVKFCTECFSYEDVLRLAMLLEDILGKKCYRLDRRGDGHRIHVYHYCANDLFNIIRSCCECEVMNYKMTADWL